MAIHFLTVIGTGLYEPVRYYLEDFCSKEQEYIQLALTEKFREELQAEDGKITVFATSQSDLKNVQNRIYGEKEYIGRWSERNKALFKPGEEKKGLKTQFKEQFPELDQAGKLEIKPIADAQTNDQIWQVFSAMLEAIRPGDEIIFDITHSFRSIPMLAIVILNYAKIVKRCTLKGIYYGAYESAEISDDGVKSAPLIDLTVFDEILEWTNAANVFLRYGNAAMVKEQYNKKMKVIPVEQKPQWEDLGLIINSMADLSDTIQIGRGADGNLIEGKSGRRRKSSVKSAYEFLAFNLNEDGEDKAQEIRPLYPLLQLAKQEFSVFDCQSNYEVGMALTQWAIDNGMVQQGFTALEETIKTYLCHMYGLNEIDKFCREYVVSFSLNVLAYAYEQQKRSKNADHRQQIALDTPEGRLMLLEQQNVLQNETTREKYTQYMNILQQIFQDDNMQIALIASKVKDARNDINHFGMRKDPKTADDLKKALSVNYKAFECIVNQEKQ